MKKKCIVRIAEGFGNQLFMYANAFSVSQDFEYELYIDNKSGYFKKKNQFRQFELDKLNISAKFADNNHIFDNSLLDLKRKFLKKIDFFKNRKLFILEKIDKFKKTSYNNFSDRILNDKIFLEGYYQTEKYFLKYKNELIKQFDVQNEFILTNNPYIHLLRNSNSVSICVRSNRFSEGKKKDNVKSDQFTRDTINYIKISIDFIKKKIKNPKFFLWSNDFYGLKHYFNPDEFTYIQFDKNKSLNDFNLFKYSKHFIVGPTPFHWWGAWLNNNEDKICIRPSNLNPSNNLDFWPKDWIKI